jgi:hypothetical protein
MFQFNEMLNGLCGSFSILADATPHAAVVNVGGPARISETLTVNSNRSACISALSGVQNPSAIAGLIIAVIVDTFNRMIGRWFWSHISKKRRERIQPAATYRYSSRAIFLPILCVRISATRFHRRPNSVLRGFRHSVGTTHVSDNFLLQAAATPVNPGTERTAANINFLSAITDALPVDVAVSSFRDFVKDEKSSKPSLSKVDFLGHSLFVVCESQHNCTPKGIQP